MSAIQIILGVAAIIVILALAAAVIFKKSNLKDDYYFSYLRNIAVSIVRNEQCKQIISSIIKEVASENLSSDEFISLIKAKILEAMVTDETFKTLVTELKVSLDDSDNIIYQILEEYGILRENLTPNTEKIHYLKEAYDLSSGVDTSEVVEKDEANDIEMVDPGYDPDDCLTPEDDDFEGEDDIEEVEMGYDPEDGIIPEEDEIETNTDVVNFDIPETNDIVSVILPKDFKGTISIRDNENTFIGAVGGLTPELGNSNEENMRVTATPTTYEMVTEDSGN